MFKTTTLAAVLGLAAASIAHAEETKLTGPIYEIAIQEVKNGDVADWAAARAPLLEGLAQTPGVEADWTLKAFFTFPEPGPLPVYVGLTRWSSIEDFSAASQVMMTMPVVQSFFEKVTMQAFVQVAPADGQPFILEDYINEAGQVLEVAVRTPKPGQEDNFDAARAGFFGKVAEQPGYIFDREFVTADGRRVVMIGWESQPQFMAALGALSQMPEMGAFFGIIDASAYQAAVVE
jgi:heme-degrading monooxygenase HmoA